MQQVALQFAGGAFHADAFVNILANPLPFAAIVEPKLAVGIPAAVVNPAAEVLREARERISIEPWPGLFDRDNFRGEFGRELLVGIERENPVMRSAARGKVLLRGIPAPRLF